MKPVIVVFGGSFNPPTHSHFSLAEQVYSLYDEVEQVVFVPVSDLYPKKDLMCAEHRVKMLELVCEKNTHFKVNRVEVDAPKLLDSIDTLTVIQDAYPEHEIWFTMGTDNLKLMPSWPCYKNIVDHFKCFVLERNQDKLDRILSSHSVFKKNQSRFIHAHQLVHSDCSSSLIRNLLRQDRSIRYLVPDEVYHYIKEKGLYTIIGTK